MKSNLKRRYTIATRPFSPAEVEQLKLLLASRAKKGNFEALGLVRQLESVILNYGRQKRSTVTASTVKTELRAIGKASEALGRRLDGISTVTWNLLEANLAQGLLDALRESNADGEPIANVDKGGLAQLHVGASLLKHLVAKTTIASELVAGQFSARGRPIDIEHPADGLVIRIRYVLIKYGIPVRPNRRTLFEAVLRLAFSAAGLATIADPLAIARKIAISPN